MTRAALKLRKYATAAAVSLRERLAHPANFVGSLFTYGLFVFVFSRVWATAFAGKADIAGYTREMCVWYFIVAEIPAFAFGRFFMPLAQDLRGGQAAYLLARPYGFILFRWAERMGAALVEAALFLALGAAMGLAAAGPLPVRGAGAAAALLASLLMAGSLQFLLQLALAMTAFWVEENSAFFWIYQKAVLVVGTLVPLEFLPEAAQRAAWWTPLPLLAYAPARIAVAGGAPWSTGPAGGSLLALLALQAAWLAAAALLCRAVFAAGRGKITLQGG
jgi:ABC-2 type transport system permease protein